ncbi:MAG: hypothetical protein DSY76_06280 [Bacteroidetes bacterium]|nr:MAG: hypothetical protein DSY76_06280 [Bacteroidota bacterium]
MNEAYDKIRSIFQKYIDISDEEWQKFSSYFIYEEYNKKDIIRDEGSICTYLYFVDKGILRKYYIDDGDEKTFHFAMENTFTTDYESYLHRSVSYFVIQALEASSIVKIPMEALEYAYSSMEHGQKLGRLLAEDYLFIFSKKIKAIYTKTPLERFLSFKRDFPDAFERVPQHYIASYLNISSVHLSRLIHNDMQKV